MSSSKPVSTTATARLKRDYARLLKDPVPYIKAVPLPSNILTWYYVVTGPNDSPYKGGMYLGKLVFPREFPFKPPAIYMITPSGRFKVNEKLCLSISDFHPDTWNPAWNVSTILTGLLSFMLEDTPTTGSIQSSAETKRQYAIMSKDFNLQDKYFCELFPELVDEIKESMVKKENKEENSSSAVQTGNGSSSLGSNNLNWAKDAFFIIIFLFVVYNMGFIFNYFY